MCEFLSAWINIETKEPEFGDLSSHSDSAKLRGWTVADLKNRREWEWTTDDKGKSLDVRTADDDPKELREQLKASLLFRWNHSRMNAIKEAIPAAIKAGVKTLYLNSLQSLPEGISFEGVKTIYLNSLQSLPEGISFEGVETLFIPDAIRKRINK